MMSAMLVAGAVAVLAGLGAIAYGIPVKEFSFGNAMIMSGTIGLCTGLILLALAAVLGELRLIAHRLRVQVAAGEPGLRALDLPGDSEPQRGTDVTAAPPIEDLWREGSGPRGRGRQGELPPMPEPERELTPQPEHEPASRPKRNLFFESSLRRDRERGEKRAADAPAAEFRSPPPAEPPSPDNSWQKPERTRTPEPPPLRRPTRAAPAFNEPEAPAPRGSEPPEVTVVKSGVVDGMAYSLYSDGSIEAQMPEGMMRFGSIAELRAHLDERG